MRKTTFVSALIVATAITLPTFAFAGSGSDRDMRAGVIYGVSARSAVTAVGEDWLTINDGFETLTLQVSRQTRVVGQGLSTLAREKQRTGNGPTIADAVGLNDHVIVTYEEIDGKRTANEVRVLSKGR